MADIADDEVVLPEDPEGETKVDKMGNLQGGREYRCRTFTVQGRGDRLYMLSTEPARCVGFRDSYLFFTKHRRLYKIIIDDEEKRALSERSADDERGLAVPVHEQARPDADQAVAAVLGELLATETTIPEI